MIKSITSRINEDQFAVLRPKFQILDFGIFESFLRSRAVYSLTSSQKGNLYPGMRKLDLGKDLSSFVSAMQIISMF